MDFLESFIVKNDRIWEEVKAELFEGKEMLVYDFMGELMSLENLEHLKEVHGKMTQENFDRIKSSEKAMKKIEELKDYLEEMDDSDEREDIEELIKEFE